MLPPETAEDTLLDRPPASVDRLPTLTEVLQLSAPAADPAGTAEVPVLAAGEARAAVDAEALTDQVLAALAPRIDAIIEARLREALAPALARAADSLIREARDELARVMREVVDEAVARAMRPADRLDPPA